MPLDGPPANPAAGLYRDRVRVYPKTVRGPYRRAKWAVLAVCLTVYYALPWVRWDRGPGHPDQAVLLDIQHGRFWFFWLEFWPEDIFYLTGALVLAAVALFLATSLFGRLWCGYACPQTVWTDLFMLAERWIEGDRNERMKRDAAPAGFGKIWRKTAKHAAWLGISFWTGGAWIMYYADAPTTTAAFWRGSAALEVYAFTALFTATTYLLAGWAREQVCTFMCPWPRFQSAMLDESSLTTTYRAWRGEPRTRGRAADAQGNTQGNAQRGGDCVDCGACWMACPTGIDIRDGIQLECINCGLCIDACDHVMERLGRERGLIGWDTLANAAARAEGRSAPFAALRPRTVVYAAVLVAGFGAMAAAVALRADAALSAQHDRAPLFVMLPSGEIRNGYTLSIANKSPAAAEFELSVSGLDGARLASAESGLAAASALRLAVPADSVGVFRVTVAAPKGADDGSQRIEFAARRVDGGEAARYGSMFLSPARR